MFISQISVAILLLSAFLFGLDLGLLYDFMRAGRVLIGFPCSEETVNLFQKVFKKIGYKMKAVKTKKRFFPIIIFIEDFFFSFFGFIGFILIFFQKNQGNLRLPAFLFAGGALICYRMTLGKFCLAVFEVVALGIRRGIALIVYGVLFPFRWVFIHVVKALKNTLQQVGLHFARKRRKRYTEKMKQKVNEELFGLLPKIKGQLQK